MNKIYRTIWNVARQCMMVVNEVTTRGRASSRKHAWTVVGGRGTSSFFMTTVATAVSMMFAPCLQAQTVSVLEPLLEYVRKTTGLDPTVYEGSICTQQGFGSTVMYGHVGSEGYSARDYINAGTVFVSTDHRGEFGCAAGFSSYGTTTNTGKWHTYATSAISSSFENLNNNDKGYIEARGGDFFQGVGARVRGNLINGVDAVIKAYGGSNFSHGFVVGRDKTNAKRTFENRGSVYGYGGSTIQSYGMLIERSANNYGVMVGTHGAAPGIAVTDKLTDGFNLPQLTIEAGGVLTALGNGTLSEVPDVLLENGSALLVAQGGKTLVQNAGFLQTQNITNFGEIILESGRLQAGKIENRENGRVVIKDGHQLSCSSLINKGYFEGYFDDKRQYIENIKDGHVIVKGGKVSGQLINKVDFSEVGPLFELKNGAYTAFSKFTNQGGTFRALETPSRPIFTSSGEIINHGQIYLETFIRDAIAPKVDFSQGYSGLLAGNLELFFDWRNRKDQWTADGYTNDRYIVGYNAAGHQDGLDLTAFATGDVFAGTLNGETLERWYRKNNRNIGRILITDKDWSPKAQEQIREAFKKLNPEVKLEFAGTGDRELFCRDNVFNVANTNAFIKSGYDGATLPFAFNSDVVDLTMGGVGANWEGSIGFQSISGLNSLTIKDGKRLIVYGSDVLSDGPLVTGNVRVDAGVLQLGLPKLVDSTARNGYLDHVELMNQGKLVVEARRNVNGQPQQSDQYEVKRLTGEGSLELRQGRLTIGADALDLESIHVADGGDLSLRGQFSASELSLEKGTAVLGGRYDIGSAVSRGGDLTFEGEITGLGGIDLVEGTVRLAATAPVVMTAQGASTSVSIGGEGKSARLTNTSDWQMTAGALGSAVGIHVREGGELLNEGTVTVQASVAAHGIVNDAVITNEGTFKISGSGTNGVGLVNNLSSTFDSVGSVEVQGGLQANGVGVRNLGQLNVTRLTVGAGLAEKTVGVNNQVGATINLTRNEVKVDGGSALDAVGIVNDGKIQATLAMDTDALGINVNGGSGAGAHGIVNRGQISTVVKNSSAKKNAEWKATGGSGTNAYGLLNTGTVDVDSKLIATAGTGSNAHGMVNLTGSKLNLVGHKFLLADAKFNGKGDAAGLYNEGDVVVQFIDQSHLSLPKLHIFASSWNGGTGIYNKGNFTLDSKAVLTLQSKDASRYAFINDGTLTVKRDAKVDMYSTQPLSALGGNGTLIVESGGTLEGRLENFMRYRTDGTNIIEALSADGKIINVDASVFATGDVDNGIEELASFLTPNIHDGANIVITDKNWSRQAIDQIKAAIRKKVPGRVSITFEGTGTDNLISSRALEFKEANVNAFLKNSAMVGTVFSGYDYRTKKNELTVGTAPLGWSDGLADSVGFRSEHGASRITINADKVLTLLGDGKYVTGATVKVMHGGAFKLGSKTLAAAQGGTFGKVILSEDARLEVADVAGHYETESIELNNQAVINNHGNLHIRDKMLSNGGAIINTGNLSINNIEGPFDIDNSGVFKISGKLNLNASSVLTNTGTLLANGMDFVGSYRFSEGAQLALGTVAVEEFLRTHPKQALALVQAGEKLSEETLMAAYGLNQLAKTDVGIRHAQADDEGNYLSSRTGKAMRADDHLIVATTLGGMAIDTVQDRDFGNVLALNGDITGDHVVSSSHDDNRTVEVRSHAVTHDASLTLLDTSYVTQDQTLAIKTDGTLKVKDFRSEALGYRPGSLVVQGGVNNSGTMNSADASAVVVTGKGLIRNQGRDEGHSLVIEGQGRYTIDGGKSRYGDVRLDGGAIDIRNGTFAVGTNAPDDKAKAVLALGGRLHNEGGVVTVGTTVQKAVPGTAEVRFGADGALMVNITDAQTKPLLNGTGTLVAEEGSRFILGESTWGRHQITSGLQADAGILDVWSGEGFVNLSTNDAKLSLNTDGLVLAVGRKDAGNGQVDTSIQALSDRFALPEVINGLINDEAMSAKRDVNSDCADIAFVERMLNGAYAGKLKDGSLNVARASSLWNSATQLSAASGLSAYALDVARTMDGQVTSHLNEDVNASGFWVKVEGRRGGADRLESSGTMTGGYWSDVDGMTFGADVLATDAWTLGVALHYEDGKLESRGDYTDTRTNVEAFGASAYAKRMLDNMSVTTRLGFSHVAGDVRQTFDDAKKQAYRIEGDLKANVLTASIRWDVSHPITNSLLLIPHADLRYTHAQLDGYGIRINGQNAFTTEKHDGDIVELGLGVTMKGTFAADEWTVQPFADLTVRPALGDTDVPARVYAVSYGGADDYRYDVASRITADVAFGVEAGKGAHAVSVTYRGSAGSQGTESHALSMSYRMAF